MKEQNGDWPSTWTRIKLDEIGTLYCGQSPPSNAVNGDGKGITYVTGPEQWDGNRVLTSKWTTEPRRTVPDGCIFVTVKGAGVGTIFPGIPCAIGRDIYAYSPSESVSPIFIQHALHATIDKIKRQAKGDIPGLSKNHLLSHEIDLPPLTEQLRIVAKIEALQERSRRAREALAEVEPLLEQFRQSVLAAAFRGDLTADWRAAHPDVEPASELLQRIRAERRRRWEQAERAKYEAKGQEPPKNWQERYVEPEPVDDAELPKLPAGWEWAAVAQLGDCVLGKMLDKAKHQTGVALPYLRNINIRWDKIVLDDLLRMYFEEDEFERYRIRDGDVLICEGGEPGRAAVWQGGKTNIKFQKALHRVRLCELIEPSWLVFHLWKDGAIGKLEPFFTGTTIKHFTGKALAKYPILVAPWDEQVLIIKRIRQALSFVNSASNQITETIAQCSYLDQSILAKAFRGELVPQDPNDEPASVILNHIQEQRTHQTKTTKRKTSKT